MNKLIIVAATAEETELMLRMIERYARHFYNVYGVHRTGTMQLRSMCEISCELESYIWKYIGSAAVASISHMLGKGVWYHKLPGTDRITIATCEVS